jgi:iron complex outermembrane receptor protein
LSALLRYQMAENHSLLLGYGITSRSPNLYERYAWSTSSMAAIMNNFAGDGNGYVGNPDLKPERAHTLSATYDWHTPENDWAFQATPYYSLVRDFIDAKRLENPGMPSGADEFVTLQYANQKARLYGLDLSGRMPLAASTLGRFGLEGLVNYTDGKNRATGDDLYNIMPLNARLALTHRTTHWDNALELELVKRKNEVSNVRNEIKTPGHGLVNLRLAYTWQSLRADFGIANLFDKFYYLPTGGAYTGQGMTMSRNGIPWGIAVPGMGRSVYAGMTLTF